MDAVKSFNAELSSLYEVKPPISKAKMTAITRGAIKAIKFYKHVVQSVEKFILKCKPEYKVPGLYVIDSIVRQSRHQFGSDKDVFAPRFAKNMKQTFVNLFVCPGEDKSKIIRVLNLWQKNQVFAPEVIQPLFDLADPNNPIHKELGTPLQSNGSNSANVASAAVVVKGSPALQKTPTKGSQQGIDGAHLGGTNLNIADPNVLAQLQQLQRLLTRSGDSSSKPDVPVHFDRKLLDFDYGDDDDEAHSSPKVAPPPGPNDSVASLLTNPEVLRQLQTLQQTMTANQNNEMDMDKLRKLQEMKQQEDEFDKHLAQTVPNLPFASECEFKPVINSNILGGGYYMPSAADLSQPPPGYKTEFKTEFKPEFKPEFKTEFKHEYKPPLPFDLPQLQPPIDVDVQFVGGDPSSNGPEVEIINLDHGDSRSTSPHDDRYNRRRSRSRERSRDRRDRDRRSRRSRSRSKSRRHNRSTGSRERARARDKVTEKEKERKKRGLPTIKSNNLSVCSTTLWVGHLSKLVHQEDLSNVFGECGDIVSIDLIPPRGCAFIVMHRRQDAVRCLTKLKNRMLHGRAITLAWAPGKGVKGKDLKDYWEGDLGVSYIPWSKIKPDIDLEMLEDGGMVDEDTMPGWMKLKVASVSNSSSLTADGANAFLALTEASTSGSLDMSQPPPVPGGGLLQPPPMSLPLVSPFQFNNRLLGPVGIPPSMLQNVPIGVPPPNLQGAALMQNQLVGLGSPFQGAANLMQNLVQNSDNQQQQQHNQNENLKTLSETLMSLAQPFGMMPQPPMGLPDDNMDIEMEDAEKPDRLPLLSEQLQASMGQFNNQRANPGGLGSDLEMDMRRDKRMDRDRSSHSRERDRDNRHRDRDRMRGLLRDPSDFIPPRERERKDDRRDRPNRWGDREFDELDRREREKTLNDRLQQMANEGVCPPNHDRLPLPRDRIDRIDPDPSVMPPSLMDRRLFPPLKGPPMGHDLDAPYNMGPPPEEFDRLPPPLEDPFLMERLDDFQMLDNPLLDNPMMDNNMMDCQDFPPLLDGPPIHPRMMRDDFEEDRFMRGGGGGGGGGRRDFRDRMRGPPGPDFFPGRDNFGPRPPLMRGGGPDFPPMRGGPMMRGPGGPPKFHPRGPNIRGPRPAPPWKERPNFGPRFDHPDFHRGPQGPPGLFDEPPHPRQRGGRFEERRRSRSNSRSDFPQDCNPPPPENDRFEKRSSRWGSSPDRDREENQDAPIVIEDGNDRQENNHEVEENKGGNTPLHDEPLTGDHGDGGCGPQEVAPPPPPPPQEEAVVPQQEQEESAPQPAAEVAE